MKMEKNEEYLNRGMDLKRLVLYFQKRFWVVIMLIVLLAIFGCFFYQVVSYLKMPVEYNALSKLYICFDID